MNNKRQVVGQYWDAAKTSHGYIHDITSNAYTTIDYPGAGATGIYGINDLGQMVGYYEDGWGTTASSGLFRGILHHP